MSSVSSIDSVQQLNPMTSAGKIDPYAIFKLNFEALGGEKQVRYDTNYHYKGEIELNDYTFELEEYEIRPSKNLRKISSNFKVLYRSGDDGYRQWAFQEEKLSTVEDYNSSERVVREMYKDYKYTDPKDKLFTSKATRKISVDGTLCYEVVINNRKTSEVYKHYYDADNFLLKREINYKDNEITQTDFSDYRDVGNIKMAFTKDISFLDTGSKQKISYSKIEKGVYISDKIFFPPEQEEETHDYSKLVDTSTTGQNVDYYA
ncbi:MAG: hypothetical protein PHY08_02505 [Candidatus Cloacimonetes bacterium]|nr:hypothetical protein [Candidatus Cloacimonadota bacterium]